MIKLINAVERYYSSANGLNSYSLFSFADNYDPKNTNYGPLRVFNDDTLVPKSGFPKQPQSEMEIISIVLEGDLSHEDSLGNKTTIGAGEVQRITAGTGIIHSDKNDSDKNVHLYQLWFLPNKQGLQPSYEQKDMDFLNTKDELIPLVTGQKVLEDVVYMNSNSTIYYGRLRKDKVMDFQTFDIRRTLIYVTEGELFVNGVQAIANDQLRMDDVATVSIKAAQDTRFILIDVPAVEANYQYPLLHI